MIETAPPRSGPHWLGPLTRCFLLLLLALVAVVSSQLRNPYLSAHRPPVLWLGIIIGTLVVALATWRWRRRRPIWLGLFVVAGFFVALTPVQRELGFQSARTRVLDPRTLGVEKLSRHVIVGYRDAETLAALLERVELAGIFVTKRNVIGRSAAEVRAEIARFQRIQTGRGRAPLLVTADQEGGIIARLSPPLEPVPSLASVAATTDWRPAVIAYATQKAQDLKSLGVNLNFAPVVDLKYDDVRAAVDLHSHIRARAISASPERVAEVAALYVETLHQQGVLATAKHFPGIGAVPADTHHFLGHLDHSREALGAREWEPFRALAAHEAAVMVGHVIVDAVDPVHPASSSASVINGVLRAELGHHGLVITDDLCMSPVVYGEGGVAGVASRSIAAGVDLLLITWDPTQIYPMLAGMLEVGVDRNQAAALAASDRRLNRARERLTAKTAQEQQDGR